MIFNWLKFIKWLATPHFHVEISEKCNYFEIMDSYWLKFIKWLATPHFHVEISEKCNNSEIMDSYWLKFIMWLATANQNANFHCRVTSLLWNVFKRFNIFWSYHLIFSILFSRTETLFPWLVLKPRMKVSLTAQPENTHFISGSIFVLQFVWFGLCQTREYVVIFK